ncbi:MAG TPA: carboxyl transferase domain-containing protein [Actinospica sp.]|jgi:acetyl/propionyl-CoA carboxylase alpha subunit/acetyl-CoA carboxylase carboxyltransferase component|nr:carboxyl transferase domain-containing protein [Actinospica sp.]
MPPITRLAILNRGESAKRALDAVAELATEAADTRLTSIIVHTDADADAWFVGLADEAVSLGPATVADPVDGHREAAYLDEERVIAALLRARADSVWVGWGFVSERAGFARRCEREGIAFVGPDSRTMALLGDKLAARRLVIKAGVPVVPGSMSGLADGADAADHAARIGYPVVLKAAAGGGGRGIRVVRGPDALAGAYDSARAEASLAFGDPTLFVEKLVPRARHVEVQVLADDYGGVWALGVRDCTVQRRHQKVIEESGSPVLGAEAERAIKLDAIRICRAAGYRNAGTVEFLVDAETGRHYFLEVNTRLQVEHPVTEQTTGVDLVKYQLHLARGGRLEGEPPPVRGHAVEARLCAEDPDRGFIAAPGRVELWRPPGGPGIRVDSGIVEGDEIVADFDSMIAKIVAWGRDRAEALARLRRALDQTAVIVAGGTTNRFFLRLLLDRPELRSGEADNLWLDGITAAGGLLAPPEPLAVIQAGIEAYDLDHAARAAAFRASASRGRPERAGEPGLGVRLRYRDRVYALEVFRTGPRTYRVTAGTVVVDAEVERTGRYERRVRCGGVTRRLICATQGSSFLVDVGGASHRVQREGGGLVSAEFPAYVAAVRVAVGDTVAAGDPLLVLESMKMESVLAAPFSGEVTGLEVIAGSQVAPGTALLRIREQAGAAAATAGGIADLAALASRDEDETGGCDAVYAVLRRYLLGYDLDAATVRSVTAARRGLDAALPAGDPALLRAEEEFLDLFADVSGLDRQQPEARDDDGDGDGAEGGLDVSAHEYLLSYLQWLDPARAGLPPRFVARLERALTRYGVHGLERSRQLEDAVFWLHSSTLRAQLLAPIAAAILQRRLQHRERLADSSGPGLRVLLDRLAEAARPRHQVVAELARDVRFRFFDEPLHERTLTDVYREMDDDLDELEEAASRPGPDRERLVERLVWCPQPLRGRLLPRSAKADPAYRGALLEVYLRRFYNTRVLTSLRTEERDGTVLAAADFEHEGERRHVVAGFIELAELGATAAAIARHLAGPPAADGELIVDLVARSPGTRPSADTMAARIEHALDGCDFGRAPRRIEVTVTSEHGAGPEHRRTQHFSFRRRGDGAAGFEEDLLHRNLHPTLAERIELWRLANFEVRRLPSVEDVFLFHCTARENPGDVRLFAIAEVRDLTMVRDADGRVVSLPRLERMGLQALAAMHQAMLGLEPRERPRNNRIVLYVRPPFDVPRELWRDLARPFGPLALGVNLEKVVLRVLIPQAGRLRDAVLHLEGVEGAEQVLVREFPVGDAPIRPLTEYAQRVLRAQRVGVPYPYEIIRMLTPKTGTRSAFPRGDFVEHDLGEADELTPVERAPGHNAANIVVGVVTNYTREIPEGMARVAILGDPTRGMGALAEPECRRILAALRLAARLRVPVEWFAVSSGARIAMDSGTENMDWIAAVLRGLIEFTQRGGEVNVVVTGVNVGAQPYWNAESTMLMHTRGILIMVRTGAMVLTGKQALDFSGGVSAEDNLGIGGLDHVMGPNGQAQYGARSVAEACGVLLRHYEHCYAVPGERFPRRRPTADPPDRDVRLAPHHPVEGSEFELVGDVFSAERNAERKQPFDIRSVMHAVVDADDEPLERWRHWRDAESAVVWDARVGGIPLCLIGLESHVLPRRGFVPADGPSAWTSGTLFPQSSRKIARAVNAASGNRPLAVLANLSGFDGSPESMRRWQLEYGAEIGRAVTNFRGPIVFVVISRYHGGAFVVFSKRLNPSLEIAALHGSFASVIGGAPAAAVVFAREVAARTDRDPRVAGAARPDLQEIRRRVHAEKLGEVAAEFDDVHTIERARRVGSVDRIIPAASLRPYLIDALERGMARADQD